MNAPQIFFLIISILVGTVRLSAAGQQPPPTTEGPVSLGVVGGATAGSGRTGAAAGLALAFDLNERLSVEGRGVFLGRGSGQMGTEITANLLVNLLSGRRRALPYIAAGGGFYRATFDLNNQSLFGMMAGGVPVGTQFVPLDGGRGWGAMPGGMMGTTWPLGQTFGQGWTMGNFMWNNTAISGPTFGANRMPTFYARRMGPLSNNGQWHMQAFTDPAFTVGGGVDISLTRGWSARPDVRALTVLNGGDVLTISTITFSVGYRF